MDSKYGCNINSGQLDTSRYSSPMPIIGLYIALASLACLAFASIDIFTGFKALGKRPRQKFWFSCKWFGTNAATLTLLSVATKLPVDLNTAMPGPHHQLTKLSGTVMLSVATAFFLPSFGNKNVEDMISNLVALAILIITVAVNIGIQMGTGVIFTFLPEHIFVICSMLFITVNVFIAAMTSEGVKDALGKSFKKVENGCTTVLENLRDTKTDSVGKIEEGMELCKEGSVWLVLALQTLFVVLTTIPIVFRWFESIRFVHHPWFEIIRFVHHPIREMRSWSRLLTIELKRSKLSYTLVTEKVEDSFFGGATGAWIERFFRGIGMIFLSLQPLASLSSRMISRSSSALIFWLFKRVDPEKEEPLKHAVVHLEDEKDFHDWMCAWHKNDVDKEMAVLSLPSTTNPPLHGTEDDIHRLTKLLHEFNPDTSLEVDPFSGLLQKITESRECKCIDTVLGMEAIAEKLGKVEVDHIESYCCDWMVKREYLERSLHPDIEGAKQLLRYIDEYGLEKTPDSSDASMDSHWQSFEGPDERIKTYQLVWFFTKQSKWYSPAVYVFLHELLDSVERKLGNRELPVDEVGQYMRSQCRPQVARLIVSILTHIFVAAYNAVSPSKTGTVEDEIGEEVVRKTLAILHLLGQLKEPLFAQLEKCYRNSSCTLREVVISNERPISSISLHPWEEHKFFTRPYKPPFPILDELFRKFCQRSGCSFNQRSDCSFRMFGVALACITHQLAYQLDGATESGASTKDFIRSLEGYWGILYYIDAVANFHNELWEPQLPIKLANVDVLLKLLLQDVEPPSSSARFDGTAETFETVCACIIGNIKSWAALVSERLDHNQEKLLGEIKDAIHKDIKARREKGENCNLTTIVDDLKKQILLVIFSALLRVFPAIHGHIFNHVDPDIHALPKLPNETDRSALIGEQLEHVEQSTWFRNTQDILRILQEGHLLAYLAAFYRRSLTGG